MINESELRQFIENANDPFITAKDLAESEGMAQQTAYKHLKQLEETSNIQKKKVGGSAVIWWSPNRCD